MIRQRTVIQQLGRAICAREMTAVTGVTPCMYDNYCEQGYRTITYTTPLSLVPALRPYSDISSRQYSTTTFPNATPALFHTTTAAPAAKIPDQEACADLFVQYAQSRDGALTLDYDDLCRLLRAIGEDPQQELVQKLFLIADADGNGLIDIDEFLDHSHTFIGDNPARIILVVGGPGSGKGVLSKALEQECNVVHLSSGDLLRDEVQLGTPLGQQVESIMAKGQLVTSAVMVALMKKRMKGHPGKRVLLDGFPRSLENANDLVNLIGLPEVALHLCCDDTILMERIMNRKDDRDDDNFETALERIRTYRKYHQPTLEWLKEHHVPIVNLDCSGPPESVWQQLQAIGKLMRPAVKISGVTDTPTPRKALDREWLNDPYHEEAV